MLHADLRVVGFRRWRRDKNEGRSLTRGRVCFCDEALSDALSLIFEVHSEIREIAAVGEVRNGARHANKTTGITRRRDNIGVAQHLLKASKICRRASLGKH